MASVWAIGDVHGEAARLDTLLGYLPRASGDTTVFLGDFIDRGPDSAAVVERALAEYDRAPDRTVLLWGNHEDMAAEWFGEPHLSGLRYNRADWMRNGGRATMESYGYCGSAMHGAPCPPSLTRLFTLLRPFWRSPDPTLSRCIWVHGGVPPGLQPEDAQAADLLWIRQEFLDVSDVTGRVVIHGHTPFSEVRVRPDKIGIDTGAAMGGSLTALQLPLGRIYQTDRRGFVISTVLPSLPSLSG